MVSRSDGSFTDRANCDGDMGLRVKGLAADDLATLESILTFVEKPSDLKCFEFQLCVVCR